MVHVALNKGHLVCRGYEASSIKITDIKYPI